MTWGSARYSSKTLYSSAMECPGAQRWIVSRCLMTLFDLSA